MKNTIKTIKLGKINGKDLYIRGKKQSTSSALSFLNHYGYIFHNIMKYFIAYLYHKHSQVCKCYAYMLNNLFKWFLFKCTYIYIYVYINSYTQMYISRWAMWVRLNVSWCQDFRMSSLSSESIAYFQTASVNIKLALSILSTWVRDCLDIFSLEKKLLCQKLQD